MAAIPELHLSSFIDFRIPENSLIYIHNYILRSRTETLEATLSQHAQEEATGKSVIRIRGIL